MAKVELTKLIETGAHFGHLTRRWNPKMKPYIFMEKNGIHIIDLKKTQQGIENAAQKLTEVVSTGRKVLFVGTKKQAQGIVQSESQRAEMHWVSERWLGGMLTNFQTIRKSIKQLQNIDKMETDGTFDKITKKERLQLTRERDKLRKVLDGIEHMNKLPGAIFIVDIKKESIAVKEAQRLNIPIFAIVDTNCDPDVVDYMIPANDDAVRAIELILRIMSDAAMEGSQKAKELKAQEAAQREREKKEREEEGGDDKEVKVKVRRQRGEGAPKGGKKFRPKKQEGKGDDKGAKAPVSEELEKPKGQVVAEAEEKKQEAKPKAEENKPKADESKETETEKK